MQPCAANGWAGPRGRGFHPSFGAVASPVRTCISVPGTCSLVASNRTPIASPQWRSGRVGIHPHIQPHPAPANAPVSQPARQPAQAASPNLGHAMPTTNASPSVCQGRAAGRGRAGQGQPAVCKWQRQRSIARRVVLSEVWVGLAYRVGVCVLCSLWPERLDLI